MPTLRLSKFAFPLRVVTEGAAGMVIAMGVFVLLGWVFDVTSITYLIRGLPAMKPNSAACFILAGASLLAWQIQYRKPSTKSHTLQRLAMACAGVVVLVAVVTWSQYRFAWNLGVDDILLRASVASAATGPIRMSEATVLGFFLSGCALLLLAGGERCLRIAQTFAAAVIAMAALMVLAYAFGSEVYRAGAFANVAPHTSASFFTLGLGLLAIRGEGGWVQVFMQDTTSARLSRRMLVSTIVVMPILAQLRIIGQRDLAWYGTHFGTAILIVSSIAVLTVLIWYATRSGNAADRKVEKLLRVNATLSGINTLIVRVSERAVLYQQACEIANRAGRFPWVWIVAREPGKSQISIRAMHGGNAELQDMLRMRMEDIQTEEADDSWVARAMRTRIPVVVDDLQNLIVSNGAKRVDVRDVLLRNGVRSFVLLPLVVAGESVGLIALHAEVAGFFDADEMMLLREMAGDISFGIQHIEKSETLSYVSRFNVLTGLPNRTVFMDRLERELQSAARMNQRVALVMCDVKRFRVINDTFGRSAGDELLRQFSKRLRSGMRFPDNLAHLSADVFVSFVPQYDVSQGGHIRAVVDAAANSPFTINGQTLTLQTTVGAAIFPEDGSNNEILLRKAEVALREAKVHGDGYRFYEPAMNAQVAQSLVLENKLRRALEQGEFVLHYQPKVNFAERKVTSVEALIRWNDPETGMVPPGQFIPLLEEIGLIHEVGDWAMRRAVEDIGRWHAMGLQAPRCAVNVSAVQLRDENFPQKVYEVIRAFGDMPCLLDIEITESLIMEDVAQTSTALQGILAAGVGISVDDFGTGFSSLAYLARLPINALKIDRAFVIDLETNAQSRSIVASIISLAHTLNLDVVAEGVETEQQADILRELRCNLMQGFLFSRAIPFDDLAKLLPMQAM